MYQIFLNVFVDDLQKWKSGPDFKHIKSSVFFKVRCPVFPRVRGPVFQMLTTCCYLDEWSNL